jgi:hypothetical protein
MENTRERRTYSWGEKSGYRNAKGLLYEEVKYPRRDYGDRRHKLVDILVIGYAAWCAAGKGLKIWRNLKMHVRNDCGHSWICPTEFRAAIPFDECLRG